MTRCRLTTMPRLKIILAAILALLPSGSMVPLKAQDVVSADPFKDPQSESAEALPPLPTDHILDEAGVFTPEEEREFAERLQKLERDSGFHIYVATYTYIYGDDANERAMRLGRTWLSNKYGAVVVFDKGANTEKSSHLGFAFTQKDAKFLTIPILRGMMERANAAAGEKKAEPPLKQIMAACEQLRVEFNAVQPFLAESQRLVSQRQWQILGLVLGVMAACFALLFVAQRFQRRSDLKTSEKYLFPDVEIAPRYGAPHAGGVAAQIDFKS